MLRMRSSYRYFPGVCTRARQFSTTTSANDKSKSLAKKFGVALFVGFAAGTASLGVWQMQRYEWKVNLIKTREEQLEQKPVPFPNLATVVDRTTNSESWEHRQVSLSGVYDYSKEVVCGPRAAPKGVLPRSAMSPMGYYIVTPMILSDTNKTVFVNRGWVSKESIETGKVDHGSTTAKQPTSIVAVIAEPESGNRFTPRKQEGSPDDESVVKLHSFDLDAMKKYADVDHETVLLDLINPDGSNSGKPVTRPIKSYLHYGVEPGTHLGYSATWFGLSLAALAIAKKLVR